MAVNIFCFILAFSRIVVDYSCLVIIVMWLNVRRHLGVGKSQQFGYLLRDVGAILNYGRHQEAVELNN